MLQQPEPVTSSSERAKRIGPRIRNRGISLRRRRLVQTRQGGGALSPSIGGGILARGYARKAREQLRWEPRVTFAELVAIMVDADMESMGLEPPGEGKRIRGEARTLGISGRIR